MIEIIIKIFFQVGNKIYYNLFLKGIRNAIDEKNSNNLFSNGIVSFRAGDVISICPPLSINKSEINFLVEGLDVSMKTFSDSL